MKETARQYFEQGNRIVVLNDKKEPLVKWTRWQKKPQTPQEFENLPWDQASAFAIICGIKLKNGYYIGAVDIDKKKLTPEAIARGEDLAKKLRVTWREKTANNGEHHIYYSEKPIKTDGHAHDFCGCEVLGTRKLCIMAPSKGYRRLNDNLATVVKSLNDLFEDALAGIGYQKKQRVATVASKRPLT